MPRNWGMPKSIEVDVIVGTVMVGLCFLLLLGVCVSSGGSVVSMVALAAVRDCNGTASAELLLISTTGSVSNGGGALYKEDADAN